MTSSPTAKFQSALPFALLPISPSLSALHASRARSLNPNDFDSSIPIYCLQCGSYLLSDGSLELYRPRKRRKIANKKSNSIKCTCHRCGFISYTSIDWSGPSGHFPKLSEPTSGDKLTPEAYPLHHKPEEHAAPSVSRSSTPESSSPVKPTLYTKPKKKTMLHEMLVRNREKEVGRTKTQQNTSQNGLAAFLSSL
ncbi:hypothetical protein AZE42_00340 [Rhizopogon vesiculosus]|uniref:Uncharacterized protein n=1 Tax=Rhizopogon vesiculosus TaxID=180088 RepID=A0A1J8QZR6_9AGAM|nr:hypothetical protein AZE42_00340 [Rhizopogon vesiculosus]